MIVRDNQSVRIAETVGLTVISKAVVEEERKKSLTIVHRHENHQYC